MQSSRFRLIANTFLKTAADPTSESRSITRKVCSPASGHQLRRTAGSIGAILPGPSRYEREWMSNS